MVTPWQLAALLTLIVLCLPARTTEAWEVPPPGEHPRLVFSQEDLPVLRAKLNQSRGQHLFAGVRNTAAHMVLRENGKVQSHLQALRAEISKSRESGVPVEVVAHGQWEVALLACENAALVYAITGEEEYGRAACRALLEILPYSGGEALRSAALIYDWCYPLFSDEEKALVRQEMARLVEGRFSSQTVVAGLPGLYEHPWALGACPINQAIYWGLLEAGYIGLAALAMEGEPGFRQEWLEAALECSDKSLMRFLDEEGYHENGPAYVGYGFSHFDFWLEALRLRGRNWSQHPRLSKMPLWYTYLILPGSIGVAPLTLPVGGANFGCTSGQDAFIWLYHAMPDNPYASLACRHVMAPANQIGYYRTWGAIFLWDRPFLPLPDLSKLPRTKWFPDGGVFMRTGWEAQDLAFWLQTQQHRCNSGKHNDYGSFYLHAYGEPFAIEGAGKVVPSAAHNLVFIDGKCMDRVSYQMPSAPLVELVDGEFATAAVVDQKEAYSEDVFFEGEDRHLVSRPLNPVEKARRLGCVVWPGQNVGAYCLIVDDIQKDEELHEYRWQMLFNPAYQVIENQAYLTLSREKRPEEVFYPPEMDCAMLSPGGQLSWEVEEQADKEMPRLYAMVNDLNPHFTVCLYPRRPDQPTVWGMPKLSPEYFALEAGHAARLNWPEATDRVVVSYGDLIEIAGVETDACLAVVRTALPPYGSGQEYGEVLAFLLVQGSSLSVDGKLLVRSEKGRFSVSARLQSQTVALGRELTEEDLDCRFEVQSYTQYTGEVPPWVPGN